MVFFLSKKFVEDLHDEQVRISPYDDLEGAYPEKLDSALNQPRMTFETPTGRVFLHSTIFDMAAAYGYHIAHGHVFVSCNKRTASAAMAAFLSLNGYDLVITDENEHVDVMVAVGEGRMSKQQLADWLRTVTRRKGD